MTKALLLINGGHIRLPGNQACLDDVLVRQAGLAVTTCSDNSLLTTQALARFDLVLDYGGDNRNEMTDAQIEALLATIGRGTPFIGLHAASLPFRSQLAVIQQAIRAQGGAWLASPAAEQTLGASRRRFFSMLGGAFVTHPPVRTFRVTIADRAHPITRDVDDFEIEDERYEIGADWSHRHVLAEAEGHPLLYVWRWGRGNVHYNALGHTAAALAHASYQRLLRQAIRWALDSAPG
jgi:type 1 glutamine amidotransferase